MTGFIANGASARVHGHPVTVVVMLDGALIVPDDASDTVWRIAAKP
ncbi:hypothetical protein [Pseudomonas duriflava]|nr:hypothetical protein [Pseudomonas duriflava]